MRFIIFLGIFLFTANAYASIPEDNQIEFQILRNGNPFGTHTLNFSKTDDDNTKVDININMKVSAGPITFFRYNHQNTEVWNDDSLITLSSETNDNGDDYFVNAKWVDDIFKVQGSVKNKELENTIYSSSYWNANFLNEERLLNTQKGIIDTIQIIDQADDVVTINGQDFAATKYNLKVNKDQNIFVWYEKNTNQWVGLEFEIKGQSLSYNRLDDL